MKYILSKNNNPYFNLAAEEYIIKNLNEDLFYMYINKPSVIIGKNQNPFSEVNVDFLREKGILLVRRLSGGGAVYQDLGNVNYSFIVKNKAEDIYNFEKYSKPIVDFLNHKLNLNSKFGGRNDITIENKKISGASQFVFNNNLIHHGTLIFNIDFKDVDKILTPNYDKIKSKGIKSVQSRVGKIFDFLSEDKKISLETFVKDLISFISNNIEYKFNEEQLLEINKIAKQKEEAIDFILDNKEKYDFQTGEYIPGFGTIQIYFNLDNNKIIDFEIFGEYFSRKDTSKLKDKFINVEYDKEQIRKTIDSINDFESYFFNLSKDKLFSLIMMK
ncbi:MAG: lipoate--protein ligase [Candidatus Hepatoplasma vulgare]|nr:MAG: lipoate--protein ligase [Candidatus Hepatoplasma sp.]